MPDKEIMKKRRFEKYMINEKTTLNQHALLQRLQLHFNSDAGPYILTPLLEFRNFIINHGED